MEWGAIMQALLGMVAENEANGMRTTEKARLQEILGLMKHVQQPEFDTSPLNAEAGQVDQGLKGKQLEAMAGLGEITRSGGMTLADKAAQNEAMNKAARQEAAGLSAIQQRMDARGTGSSGANLAMQLSNNQSSANRANDIGMKTAGNAQRRYLDALLKQGQMASNMSDQDMKARQARDVMKQYNQKNRNTYSQQRYANEAANIAARAGATQPLVALGMQGADNYQTRMANYGAAGGQAVDNVMRDQDTYDSEPTGYGDEDNRKRIDDEFENG